MNLRPVTTADEYLAAILAELKALREAIEKIAQRPEPAQKPAKGK